MGLRALARAPVLALGRTHWFVALDIETDQSPIRSIHVGHVRLGEVVDVGVFGFAPVIAADIIEAGPMKLVSERLVVEDVVMNVVEIVLAAEEWTHDQIEILGCRVDLGELCEVGHGDSKSPARFEHAMPFGQDRVNTAPFEMLENMTVVNHVDTVGRDKREVVDAIHMVDVSVFDHIDVHVAGNEPLAATQMKFHVERHRRSVVSCQLLYRKAPNALGNRETDHAICLRRRKRIKIGETRIGADCVFGLDDDRADPWRRLAGDPLCCADEFCVATLIGSRREALCCEPEKFLAQTYDKSSNCPSLSS